MRTFKKSIQAILTLCLFGCTVVLAQQKEVFTDSKIGSQIPGNQILLSDKHFYLMMENGNIVDQYFFTKKVQSAICLSINRNTSGVLPDFTTEVTLNVLAYQWLPGNSFGTREFNITLKVSNVAAGGSVDKATYTLPPPVHLIYATVQSVNGPVDHLKLEGIIEIDRIYKFNPETIPVFNIRGTTTNDEVVLSWSKIEGAEAYDVEWAYINSESLGGLGGTSPEVAHVPGDYFKLKSTRITTSKTNYVFPVVYEKGHLLYRVRAVGRSVDPAVGNPLINGKWSYEHPLTGNTLGQMPRINLGEGHENNLNWQSSVMFAEEGKQQTSVSYFDGALYPRQGVSKVNSDNGLLVGETIYDHAGRAAINILPAPLSSQKIKFTPRFNRNAAGESYNKSNFENNLPAGKMADPMRAEADNIGGAANYYSEYNPDRTGHNAFIPDAKGYPFIHTEYTPDATGRIKRLSAPGPDFRLGSGHEAKFFYGQPDQVELDRLFGNDAGYAQHYTKELQVDGNGNISGAYRDSKGRVVATFLSGPVPSNVDDVNSPQITGQVVVDVLGKRSSVDNSGIANKLNLEEKSRILNQNRVVSEPVQYTLNYKLRTTQFADVCSLAVNPQEICYNCVMDVQIKITNSLGQQMLLSSATIGSTSMTLGVPSTDCNTPVINFDGTTTTGVLEPGEYQVSKILTINREALESYTRDHLLRSAQCKTFEQFVQEETAKIDLTGCDLDCETCLTQVGDYSKYSGPDCEPNCLSRSAYEELVRSCNDLCNTVGRECDIAYEAMLNDVSPGGQYGEIMLHSVTVGEDGEIITNENGSANGIDPSQFPLSVFNENNFLPLSTQHHLSNWRRPQYDRADGTIFYGYLDENGEEDFIDVHILGVNELGGYVTNVTLMNYPLPYGKKPGDVVRVPPSHLARLEDFLVRWKPSWAKSLVKYHPEYASLVYCRSLQASHDFDLKLASCNTLQEAFDNGFNSSSFNFMGTSSANATDPYFSNNLALNPQFSQQEYDRARTKFNNFTQDRASGTQYNLLQTAHLIVNCPQAGVTIPGGTICNTCPAFNGINTDAEWNILKGLYISFKQGFQEEKRARQSIINKSYNACIGDNTFNPFRYDFFRIPGSSPYFDNQQPCSFYTRMHYADKVSRFHTAAQLMNLDEEFEDCRIAVDNTPIGNPPVEAMVCSDVVQELMAAGREKADMKLMEDCGVCPNAVHLQTLLSTLAQRDGLESDNIQLSCYPASDYPEFSSLEPAMAQRLQGTTPFYYDFNVFETNSRQLVANIGRGINNPNECELRLRLIDNIPFDFSNVIELCCINYLENPQFFPQVPNRNFTIVATYIDPATQERRQARLEGTTSCFDIAGCTFAPSCEMNLRGKHLKTVLSTLTFDFDTSPATPADLVNESKTTNLTTEPYSNFLNTELLQNDLGTNASWTVDLVGSNILLGTLQGTNGVQWQVELTKTTTAFNFNEIIRIGAIKLDSEAGDPVRTFTLNATVRTNLGEFVVVLGGYSNLELGGCEEVTFGGEGQVIGMLDND